VGLKLNGTHQLLAYNVNLPGDNTDTINKNTATLTDASKETDLGIKVEKTTYVILKMMRDFFFNAAWEQQMKENMVVGGTSCCVKLGVL
jgi:hypothetical protein